MIRLIIHIALSVLLLLSATGVTVNMHYCHDQLIDFAIMSPAESCCESAMSENHASSDVSICTSGHCVDKTVFIESTNDFVATDISFSFENTRSFDLFFTTPVLINDLSTRESTTTTLRNFKKPPNPQKVVLSQIQSFLI